MLRHCLTPLRGKCTPSIGASATINIDLSYEQQKVEKWALVGVEVQVMMNCKNCGTLATNYLWICDATCSKQSKTRKLWRVLQLCIIEAGSIVSVVMAVESRRWWIVVSKLFYFSGRCRPLGINHVGERSRAVSTERT